VNVKPTNSRPRKRIRAANAHTGKENRFKGIRREKR